MHRVIVPCGSCYGSQASYLGRTVDCVPAFEVLESSCNLKASTQTGVF